MSGDTLVEVPFTPLPLGLQPTMPPRPFAGKASKTSVTERVGYIQMVEAMFYKLGTSVLINPWAERVGLSDEEEEDDSDEEEDEEEGDDYSDRFSSDEEDEDKPLVRSTNGAEQSVVAPCREMESHHSKGASDRKEECSESALSGVIPSSPRVIQEFLTENRKKRRRRTVPEGCLRVKSARIERPTRQAAVKADERRRRNERSGGGGGDKGNPQKSGRWIHFKRPNMEAITVWNVDERKVLDRTTQKKCGRFLCPHFDRCTYSAKSQKQLMYHLYLHQQDVFFTCKPCNKKFNNEREALRHAEVFHGREGYSTVGVLSLPRSDGTGHFDNTVLRSDEEEDWVVRSIVETWKRSGLIDSSAKELEGRFKALEGHHNHPETSRCTPANKHQKRE